MKTTVIFEAINGYLVRLYPNEVTSDTKIKYKGVLTIEINDKNAIAKGLCGELSHKNYSDIYEHLKNLGVEVCTWERYDASGNLKSSKTIKLIK